MRVEGLSQLTPRVLALAEKYQYPQKHSEHVAVLAAGLFNQLMGLHKLPPEALTLLEHGALLHDIGYFIAHKRHHRHGAYLVRADALLRGYPPLTRTMLALLVRNHRKTPKDPATLLPAPEALTTWKLCALLNVADGLEYGHDSGARLVAADYDAKGITLTVAGCDLQALHKVLKKKAQLMHEVFSRKVHFVSSEPARPEEPAATPT